VAFTIRRLGSARLGSARLGSARLSRFAVGAGRLTLAAQVDFGAGRAGSPGSPDRGIAGRADSPGSPDRGVAGQPVPLETVHRTVMIPAPTTDEAKPTVGARQPAVNLRSAKAITTLSVNAVKMYGEAAPSTWKAAT